MTVQVVENASKHEELDVASHAVTGSSAQLVANSRTKALPKGSNRVICVVMSQAALRERG